MKYIRGLMILLLLCSCFAVSAAYAEDPPLPTPVGRVVWIKGTLMALMPNHEERNLQRQSVIYLHDTLMTDAKSYAQIIFTDNTLMTFRPDTKFYVSQYSFTPKAKKGSWGKSIMNLIEGGFRTITGFIAKDNPTNYQISTAVATIGVRGTDYAVVIQNNKVYVGYYSGTPCVKGKQGPSLCLNANKPYAEVNSVQQVATPLTQQPVALKEKLDITPATISPFNSPIGTAAPARTGGTVTSFCISQ